MTPSCDSLIERLARTRTEPARIRLLRQARRLQSLETALALADEVPRRGRLDLHQAERLAHACHWLADHLHDDFARARSLRATGHLHALRGDWRQALVAYQEAVDRFERLDRDTEVGITLSGGVQALIYRGAYEDADAWVSRARAIFRRHGDTLRLARLDSNAGNIRYRQDRFREALTLYRRAYRVFRRGGHAQDAAVTLRNMAGCYWSMDAFDRALRIHRTARAYCQEQQLPLLVAEADYNIAYLHFMRGEYARAIDLYRAAREQCRQIGDRYHRALCDLDQSELYLELNLLQEGTDLATSALEQFRRLRLRYEAAKATVNLAVAAGRTGQVPHALALFEEARAGFVAEGNHVWPALIDLYRGSVLLDGPNPADAREAVGRARGAFEAVGLLSRVAQCDLVLARLDLDQGTPASTEARCRAALAQLAREPVPALAYQAHLLLGLAHEAGGSATKARRAYESAQQLLEQLRSQVRGDELKVAFLRDKLSVYEALLALELIPGVRQRSARIFTLIERAKSRSLAEMVALKAVTGSPTRRTGSQERRRVERLRQDLTWIHRQTALEEMKGGERSDTRLAWLRERAHARESDLGTALLDARATDREFAELQGAGTLDLATFQRRLPDDTTLLEFFEVRGVLHASVIGRNAHHITTLGPMARIKDRVRLLQFQLSKYRLGKAYTQRFATQLALAADAHLRLLYDELIRPVRRFLSSSRLVIVPHGHLHHLPFHALASGDGALVDDFVITYAPSASVLYHCWMRPPSDTQGSLVLGVPDARTPFVREEVVAVAARLPGARVFLGKEATTERLKRLGRRSRVIHIATHGFFRQDNPLFSAVQLGNGPLNLFELYDLQIGAELVALSGCGTGLSVLTGGDELLGLVRGWLYAGAQSVLVTLWDVNDRSTAAFMAAFYRGIAEGLDRGSAARRAMLERRAEQPHPYFWAPFTVVGHAGQSQPPTRTRRLR